MQIDFSIKKVVRVRAIEFAEKHSSLSQEKKFYVYVLTDALVDDCSIRGINNLVGEPFYVGKGVRGRWERHITEALNGHTRGLRNKAKVKRIRNIMEQMVMPQVETLGPMTEAHALAWEEALIREIGRRNKRRGPLLNLTDGGIGHKGYKRSKRNRRKLSKGQLKRTPEQIEESSRKRKATNLAKYGVEFAKQIRR